MQVKVNEIMNPEVFVASPYDPIGEIRERMLNDGIHAVPVVDCESMPLGILTSSDLVEEISASTLICEVMTVKVFTVPQYSDIHIAARIMRNHMIHHVVVTHEKKVVGILSTFDLLRLVEDHRFVMKNGPTEQARKGENHK